MLSFKRALAGKDFWSGVMFMTIGALAVGIGRNYPFGSSSEMGPGYFPIILGGVLICMGLVISARGLRHIDPIKWSWDVRALMVLSAVVVAFGFLIGKVGLVPSVVFVALGSAAAIPNFRLWEIALLTGGLVFFVVAIFVWGLHLPLPLFRSW